MQAVYHLPGLFEFHELYRVFLPLFRRHRDWFYDWAAIGSIYGAPAGCRWDGGRSGFGEADPAEVGHILALAGFESIDDLEAYYVKTCGRDDVPAEILEQTVREVSTNESKCKLPPFPVNEAVLRRIAGI